MFLVNLEMVRKLGAINQLPLLLNESTLENKHTHHQFRVHLFYSQTPSPRGVSSQF